MALADREWLLYCPSCGEWTGLNRFLAKQGRFQGEHSLLMNGYLENDLLLGKFLIHHAGHEVIPIPDSSPEYARVLLHEERFLDSLIDQIVEEQMQIRLDRQSAREAERREGYQALLVLRGMLSEKIREIEGQQPADPTQARIHLGKSLGLEWCREQVEKMLDVARRANAGE